MRHHAEPTNALAPSAEDPDVTALGATDFSNAWLMVVDMQHAFSLPDSRWGMSTYGAARLGIEALASLFGERIVWTRFVPPAQPSGRWIDYYKRWPEFTEQATASADPSPWALDMGALGEAPKHVVSATTFSKWVPEQLPEALLSARHIVLTGVAYECCVLATALAAIDDGCRVHVVTDAVGAGSEPLGRATTTILDTRSPQLRLTDVRSLATLMAGSTSTITHPSQRSAKEAS
ncbi:cysteine hydrolase family protein [Arthrobacter sp. NPDC055138]